MSDPLPPCPACGGELQRVYSVTPVLFNAAGFTAADVSHFEKQVGPERYARFVQQRDDAERRAKAGQLTEYERSLD